MTRSTPHTAGSLYFDELSAGLADWIATECDSTLWGAIETPTRHEGANVWFVVSVGGNHLATVGKDGRTWREISPHGPTAVVNRGVKRYFSVDGREMFHTARVGAQDLVRLFELAFLPRAEGLYAAARDHLDERRWKDAMTLLDLAEEQAEGADRESSTSALPLVQRIALDRAFALLESGGEGTAVGVLAALSRERADDDLLLASQRYHDRDAWLPSLALAHEEAERPLLAASVYRELRKREPKEVRLHLAEARALARGGDLEGAGAAYDRFIEPQLGDDVHLEAGREEAELVGALRESAEVLVDSQAPARAARRYLELIRHTPFDLDAYQRLFALSHQLSKEEGELLTVAREILRLVAPRSADVAESAPAHEPVPLPASYESLSDDEHDALIHPGERRTATVAQRFVGSLTRDERETKDIERHAQPVEQATHPDVFATLAAIAGMLGIDPPRVYLSYGTSGIEVVGVDDPFVLLAARHLEPGTSAHLPLRELTFALGTQLEHIRADHLLLTSSEFWKAFGATSLTAVLALIPLGDLVGKFTDGPLLKLLSKVKNVSNPALQAALSASEEKVRGGAAAEGLQSAYTAALARIRADAVDTSDDESLVKERLADFARAAQWTGDRVGLLACDDLVAAVHAMVKLSSNLAEHHPLLADRGYAEFVAAARDNPAFEELNLRVAELLKFALSEQYRKYRSKVLEG